MNATAEQFAHHTTQHTISMKQLGVLTALTVVIVCLVVMVKRIKRKGSDES